MTFRLSKRAQGHLRRIHDYIAKDDPIAATEVLERLVATFDRLVAHPQLGHLGRRPRTREFVQPLYVIVYRLLESNQVFIAAILHGKHHYPAFPSAN